MGFFVRRDRGATDPILVLAAVAVSLVLLVGGSFAVGALRANADALNAKKDLVSIGVAEASWVGANGTYTGTLTDLADPAKNSVGFSVTSGTTPQLVVGTNCYGAVATSKSGVNFWVASTQQTPTNIGNPLPATAPTGWPAACAWFGTPVTAVGTVTTLAGSGTAGSSNGTGTAATFNQPYGITIGPGGNGYVADAASHQVRMVTPAGVATTVAGTGAIGLADGAGNAATFTSPAGITVDGGGNTYMYDYGRIRKITSTGTVSTLAGAAFGAAVEGDGATARFGQSNGMAVNSTGTKIYLAEGGNNRIRLITVTGGTIATSTIAGSTSSTPGHIDGGTSVSELNNPQGVVLSADGKTLYISDTTEVRALNLTTNTLSTLAGSATSGYADGTALGAAQFSKLVGITVTSDGSLYVRDNMYIRKIAAGQVTTVAGGGVSGTDGVGTAAGFGTFTSGLAADSSDILWATDTNKNKIRQITTK